MTIDHAVEQLLERIRQDPELRRRLAQLVFGPESVRFADQIGQLAALLGRLAETVQGSFRAIGDRFALIDARLAEPSRIVDELAAQQRATTNLLQALTDRMERVERQQAETTVQIQALTSRIERVEQQIAQLTDRMERVEQQIAELTTVVRRHTDDLAQLREGSSRTACATALRRSSAAGWMPRGSSHRWRDGGSSARA
ncbi:hypothetical protein OO015_11600 [Thermomicrobium sp. 4228-Ro]|uniref:hypothetical protein n=1 Tax=Thermomicrobium sp. 4228-Ro TaxID=2993937 RepID=UPI002248FFE6|nr:hypothetical protein [Thermomicrobium sp. 4228-Ro]MCX2728135.1 hypothetical protein [Thermomicrobium sp. 4228-Ro]